MCQRLDPDVLSFISAGWWPNNPGSALIVPAPHYENIYDIPERTYALVNEIGRRVAIAMKQEYRCEGTSFRQHNEAASGQSVNHYHLWVFPRYRNDRLYELYSEGSVVSVKERQGVCTLSLRKVKLRSLVRERILGITDDAPRALKEMHSHSMFCHRDASLERIPSHRLTYGQQIALPFISARVARFALQEF